MGKSSKKSDVEVAVAPLSVPLTKSAKKGKRDAEKAIEKPVSAKKQKREVAAVVPKQEENKKPKKASREPPQKKAESSSSGDQASSESEEESTKVTVPSKKLPPTGAKTGTPAISVEEEPSDSSDEDAEPAAAIKKPPVAVPQKKPESNDSSSEGDSDEDEEDTVPENVNKPTMKSVKKESSSDEDEGDSSEEISDDEPSKPQQKKKPMKSSAKSSSFEEDSSDEASEDEQPMKTLQMKPTKASAQSSSSEEDSSDEDSVDEHPMKTPQKKDSDVKMKDAPSGNATAKQTTTKSDNKPKTPGSQRAESKTIFVGNLSYDAGQDDVADFFKDAGEIADVRLAIADDGRFKGYGHVEFTTEDAAQKALEMNGMELLGRAVRLDVALERSAYTPSSGKEGNSYQKGGKGPSCTIFVKGFDKSVEEDEIRSSLEEHFGTCGEITRLSIPKDYETGSFKGMAYMDFKEQDAFSKALELDGSELGGYSLTVDEAKPRVDSRDGGGRSGGKDNSGRGSGRFGGQRGGRGGRGGGRGRGGGGRGRGGTPNRQSFGAASAGKKTTFSDY